MDCIMEMWRPNIESNSVKFVWPAKLCALFGNIYSDPFEFNNVIFEIGTKFNSNSSNSVSMWVRKSTSELAETTICMTVDETEINIETSDWKDICYITKDFIIPEDNRIIYSINDLYRCYQLTITCEIFWRESIKWKTESNLYNQMPTFFNSDVFSDVTIIVDNFKIPAHKIVLSALSPVFSKLLQSDDMKEVGSVINIEGIEPEIVHEMLHYFYTGKTKAIYDVEVAMQMLKVADVYKIKKLEKICFSSLQNNMRTDNVLKILDFADDRNAIELRTNAINFIISNSREVFLSDDFESLFRKKQDLILEITRATVDNLTVSHSPYRRVYKPL